MECLSIGIWQSAIYPVLAMSSQLDILALEPFYGGVRKSMLETVMRCSRHRWTLLKLAAAADRAAVVGGGALVCRAAFAALGGAA